MIPIDYKILICSRFVTKIIISELVVPLQKEETYICAIINQVEIL